MQSPPGQPPLGFAQRMPNGDIQRVGHLQPQAQFGQPGKADEVIVDGQFGMPNTMQPGMMPGMNLPQPGELKMTTHPPHRVAPPDILQIEALRLRATTSLMEREDVVIVASVSAIYGLGDPVTYRGLMFSLNRGEQKSRDASV